MKANTTRGIGAGWHKESLRHRNAKLKGKAGGNYAQNSHVVITNGGVSSGKKALIVPFNYTNFEKAKENGAYTYRSKKDYVMLKYDDGTFDQVSKKNILKDSDGDGVSDSKDCQPHNPNAQGTNAQVATAFADGQKDSSGTMFAEENAIYSYGYHFPMAVRLKDGRILINKDKYSRTTSKQQTLLKRALTGKTLIEGDTAMLMKALGRSSYAGTRDDAWGGRTDKINNRLRSLQGEAWELPAELRPTKDPELQKLREEQR